METKGRMFIVMDYEALYQAIFHRKSVRKYDAVPLGGEPVQKLQELIGTLQPLCPEIGTQIKILSPEQLKSNAPQSVGFYSEKKEGSRMNAGFMMEQIDLFLSANNIGACWLGMAKPVKGVLTPPQGMEYVTTLCFGTPAQEMHRSAPAEFKRNTLNEISDVTDLYHVLEAVRLAPSAMNSQPWFFSGTPERLTVSRKKSMMLDKLNQIDIGIALCCLWLSLKHQGKEAVFDFSPATVSKGRIFMANVSVKDAE